MLRIVLSALQALLLLLLVLGTRDAWPQGDDSVYFEQALGLGLGLYPGDPARPLLYPQFLALVMSLAGTSLTVVKLAQALLAVATGWLALRLADRLAGREWGWAALAAIAFFPDGLLFATWTTRECFTAFLLAALLNALERMQCEEASQLWPLPAGVLGALLVLVKPEFGSLMLLLAVAAAWRAWREREAGGVRRHALPWVACGLIAVASVIPMTMTLHSVHGEWMFVNTYKGLNSFISHAGELEPRSQGRFEDRDHRRYQSVYRIAGARLWEGPSDWSYGRRDADLLRSAGEELRSKPGQSASLLLQRGVATLFRADERAAREATKRGWSAPAVSALRLGSWFLDAVVVAFALLGAWQVRRRLLGSTLAWTLLWFVAFYSTMYYQTRLRIAVWPVLAVLAAAGARAAWESRRRGDRGLRLLAPVGALVLIVLVNAGRLPQPGGPAAGPSANNLVRMSMAHAQAGSEESLRRELGLLLRDSRAPLPAAFLLESGDRCWRLGQPRLAAFLFEQAALRGAGPAADERLALLSATHRRVALSEWQRAAGDADMALWRSELEAPALPTGPIAPLGRRLTGSTGEIPIVTQGFTAGALEARVEGRVLWLRWPASAGPPPELLLEYHSAPR